MALRRRSLQGGGIPITDEEADKIADSQAITDEEADAIIDSILIESPTQAVGAGKAQQTCSTITGKSLASRTALSQRDFDWQLAERGMVSAEVRNKAEGYIFSEESQESDDGASKEPMKGEHSDPIPAKEDASDTSTPKPKRKSPVTTGERLPVEKGWLPPGMTHDCGVMRPKKALATKK